MDKRRPIQSDTRSASRASESDADRFKAAMAGWASTVTLVAVRGDGSKVHATTVTSFAPLSADPPTVVVCLGPSAQVLPFAEEGARVGVSLLCEGQQRWATIFADSFPVRSPEWSSGPAPLLPGAVVGLTCTVRAVHPVEGGSRILVCAVDSVDAGEGEPPLLYWQRNYVRLPG